MSPITVLTARDIENLIRAPTFLQSVLESQRSVFSAFSSQAKSSGSSNDGPGDIQIPPRLTVVMPQHKVLVMPSRAAGSGGTGCKVVSVPTADGDARGLPGSTIILDESTGAVAGLVNSRTLTALRNACGSALFYQSLQPVIADKYPSHASPRNLTVFGSGHQSFHHVSVFLALFPTIKVVTIIGRSPSKRLTGLVDKLSDEWRGNVGGKGIWRGDRLGKRKVEVRWGIARAIGEDGEEGTAAGENYTHGEHEQEADENTKRKQAGGTESVGRPNIPGSGSGSSGRIGPDHTPVTLREDVDVELALASAAMQEEDKADISDFEVIEADPSAVERSSKRPQTNSEPFNSAVAKPAAQLRDVQNDHEEFEEQMSEGNPTPTDLPPINLPQVLHNSHIVICCTPSTKPLFASGHLTSGTAIILIGSYTPAMQEVEAGLVLRAGSGLVVDSEADCEREAGELIRARKTGWTNAIVELGELVNGDPGLAMDAKTRVANGGGDVYMYKSVGIGIQDIAIASACLLAAKELKIGTIIPNYD